MSERDSIAAIIAAGRGNIVNVNRRQRSHDRWRVQKRQGRWQVIDRRCCWHSTFDTLTEAHTEATQNSVAEVLYAPGGLTTLATLLRVATLQEAGDLQRLQRLLESAQSRLARLF